MSIEGALTGRRVIVTRPAQDAAELVALLRRAGATVIAAPAIRVDLDAPAVRTALAAARYDWIVVTSANGVRTLPAVDDAVDHVAGRAAGRAARLAVVGPTTAAAARSAGLDVDLQPDDALGGALVAAFDDAPPAGGRVLVVQADRAGPQVADGLRDKRWTVDAVVAYRTVDVGPDADVAGSLPGADAITFLSGSAARSFVDAYGVGAVPAVVACIGPSTATVCRHLGLPSPIVAAPHTAAALLRVLVSALDR